MVPCIGHADAGTLGLARGPRSMNSSARLMESNTYSTWVCLNTRYYNIHWLWYIYIYLSIYIIGWWYTYPSEKYEESQLGLGWWHSKYMEHIEHIWHTMTSPVSNLILYTSTRPRRRQRKLSKFANLVESVRQANRTGAVQDWRKVRLSLFMPYHLPLSLDLLKDLVAYYSFTSQKNTSQTLLSLHSSNARHHGHETRQNAWQQQLWITWRHHI